MFIRQSQIKSDCSLLSSSLKTRSIHCDFWGIKLHWMKADVAQIHEAITSLHKTTCFGAQINARYSSQGADVVSVFQIFPLDLFVCWNWREAFRVSSRLSQDKTKMQGERPGSESLFRVWNQTFTKTPSRVDLQHLAAHGHVTGYTQRFTLFVWWGLVFF